MTFQEALQFSIDMEMKQTDCFGHLVMYQKHDSTLKLTFCQKDYFFTVDIVHILALHGIGHGKWPVLISRLSFLLLTLVSKVIFTGLPLFT